MSSVPSIIPDTPTANGRGLWSERMRLGCDAGVERGMTVKIYTKTGDQGMTGLLGSGRVPKDDVRIEAYGTVDELNAVLGLVRAHGLDSSGRRTGRATPGASCSSSARPSPTLRPPAHFTTPITAEHVARLETTIDALETELKPLTQFILPGGTLAAAHIHLARTVCRRAERLTVRLSRQAGEDVPRLP